MTFLLIPTYLLVFNFLFPKGKAVTWLPTLSMPPSYLGFMMSYCQVFLLNLSGPSPSLLRFPLHYLSQGFAVLSLHNCPGFFHLFCTISFSLYVDDLQISSPELSPEPQAHIFRCCSISHLHSLKLPCEFSQLPGSCLLILSGLSFSIINWKSLWTRPCPLARLDHISLTYRYIRDLYIIYI